uniref:Uncharacterized protein n=1 Tax=Anguilla anguilla TaxID=7936 RepID=A0A0E9Q9M7_ANGAN
MACSRHYVILCTIEKCQIKIYTNKTYLSETLKMSDSRSLQFYFTP